MIQYELWRRTGQGPWRSEAVGTRKDTLQTQARREVREATKKGKVVGFYLGRVGDMPLGDTQPQWEVGSEDRGDRESVGTDR